MRYTTLGRRTGLRVSELALGTAGLASGLPSGTDVTESRRIVDRFAEAGGTFVDTADSYQGSDSEEFLGHVLATDRDHFVLASKYTLGGAAPGISTTGNSRKVMVRAVEASLRRLRTDYLDVYWAHFPDPLTPVDEVVAAFDDLVRSGKILHGALSNFPAWRVARASTLAELRGWAPIVGVQVEYSLAERSPEREVLPMAEALGLAAVVYSPLGGGLLTGKYRTSSEGRLSTLKAIVRTEDTPRRRAVVDAVLRIAEEVGASPAQVSMAWLRERGERSSSAIVPIVGPRSLAHLEEYLGSLDVVLSPEQYDELDRTSRPELGVPHETAHQRQPAIRAEQAFIPRPVTTG